MPKTRIEAGHVIRLEVDRPMKSRVVAHVGGWGVARWVEKVASFAAGRITSINTPGRVKKVNAASISLELSPECMEKIRLARRRLRCTTSEFLRAAIDYGLRQNVL